MAITNTYGRAEFKPESDVASCFEGVPARAVLAPLFGTDRYFNYTDCGRAYMLAGSRGTGKTHLLRLLSAEGVPLHLNELDKGALQNGEIRYRAIVTHPEPVAIVVDDLHYLIKAMYVSQLRGGRLTEEKVLDRLKEFRTLADRMDTKLIWVVDEGPGGLSMRFQTPENKKRFLVLMDWCRVTPDDMQIYHSILGMERDMWSAPPKTVNLDYRGLLQSRELMQLPEDLALRIWPREFAMSVRENWWEEHALPDELAAEDRAKLEQIIQHAARPKHTLKEDCKICPHVRTFVAGMERELRNSMRQAGNRLASQLNMTDIPFATVIKSDDKNPQKDRTFYAFSRLGVIEQSRAFKYSNSWVEAAVNSPIATIRELEIVSQACGGISRKTLGLPNVGRLEKIVTLDSPADQDGITFNRSELNKIRSRIKQLFNSAVRFNPQSLVDCFYYAQTDEELLVGMVEADLGLE